MKFNQTIGIIAGALFFMTASLSIAKTQPLPKETPLAFGKRFFEAINQPPTIDWDQHTKKICPEFWYKPNSILCHAIPWKHLLAAKMNFTQVKAINDTMGFVAFNSDDGKIPFSLTYFLENGRWVLDYENTEVIRAFTKNWFSKTTSAGEFRFFETPNSDQLKSITTAAETAHFWIAKNLHLKPINDILFIFGLEKATSDLLFQGQAPASERFGGSSRGKAITFSGPLPLIAATDKDFPSVYSQSVFLHEMLHEYTLFTNSWGHKPGIFPCQQSLLIEGIVMRFHLEYLMKSGIHPPTSPAFQGLVSRMAEGIKAAHLFQGKPFKLLNEVAFRDFDQTTGGLHPGYFIGASLADLFITKHDLKAFQNFWISLSGTDDPEKVKNNLSHFISESEVIQHKDAYLKKVGAFFENLKKQEN